MGAFVAGMKAGHHYNTFPLMDGHLFPERYWEMTPWYRNMFENIAAVQFDHRVLAVSTLTSVVGIAASSHMWAGRARHHHSPFRSASFPGCRSSSRRPDCFHGCHLSAPHD